MKKLLFILAAVLLLLTACHHDVLDNSTGTVTFSAETSRGVTASIDWPSLTDKVWTFTAVKTDGGADTGAGTYDELVLTDSLGPFSIGAWTFTLTDSTGKWTGTVSTTINVGANVLAFSIRSTTNKGTLSIEDCNFLRSKIGANVNYVDCYVDDNRINGTDWVVTAAMTEDGDFYTLPTLTQQLTGGIHTIRLYYGADNGGFSSDTISFRVVNGMTTHITIGEQEGTATITVTFDVVEALVE